MCEQWQTNHEWEIIILIIILIQGCSWISNLSHNIIIKLTKILRFLLLMKWNEEKSFYFILIRLHEISATWFVTNLLQFFSFAICNFLLFFSVLYTFHHCKSTELRITSLSHSNFFMHKSQRKPTVEIGITGSYYSQWITTDLFPDHYIIKCAWRSNFIFLEIFDYFFR